MAPVGGEDAGEIGYVGGDEVAGDEVFEEVEPEEGDLGEDAAFVGDRGAEHVVEGGDAVGGDEEERGFGVFGVGCVDVSDLASGEERGFGAESGFEYGLVHECPFGWGAPLPPVLV